MFIDLVGHADRLIAEAGHIDGALGVRRLAEALSDRGPAVTDLAWAALTPWRQLLNQLTTREHLEHMREGATVTIRHSSDAPSLGRAAAGGMAARQHRARDHDAVRLGPAPAAIRASARCGWPTPRAGSSRSTGSWAAGRPPW